MTAPRASFARRRLGDRWVPGCVLALSLLFAVGVAKSQEPGRETHLSPPPAVITSIRQLNSLSAAQARLRLPTHLEAVVTYSDPPWGLLFIQDQTGAAYVDVHGKVIPVSQGMRVRVDAVTIPGDVFAAIGEPKITVKGSGPMPAARHVSLAELGAGAADSQWVETTGVLHPAYKYESYRIAFRISDGPNSALVVIPRRGDDFVERLIDAKVRLRGVCGSVIEGAKRVGTQIFVSRPDDIVVEDAASASVNPYAIAETPLASVSSIDLGQRFLHRIRVTGRVASQSSRLLFLESSGHAVPVIPWHGGTIKQGDAADVVGFPSKTEYGTGLADAVVRVDETVRSPQPQKPLVTYAAALKGDDLMLSM